MDLVECCFFWIDMEAQRALQEHELCLTKSVCISLSVTCVLNREIYPLTNSQSASGLLTGRKWDPYLLRVR